MEKKVEGIIGSTPSKWCWFDCKNQILVSTTKINNSPRGDDMGTLTSNFHQSTNDVELECKEIFTSFSHTHNTNVCY
jgi:hypothetical protein